MYANPYRQLLVSKRRELRAHLQAVNAAWGQAQPHRADTRSTARARQVADISRAQLPQLHTEVARLQMAVDLWDQTHRLQRIGDLCRRCIGKFVGLLVITPQAAQAR